MLADKTTMIDYKKAYRRSGRGLSVRREEERFLDVDIVFVIVIVIYLDLMNKNIHNQIPVHNDKVKQRAMNGNVQFRGDGTRLEESRAESRGRWSTRQN